MHVLDIVNFKNGVLTPFFKIYNDVEDANKDIKVITVDDKSVTNHINCSEMLNAFQERKRCNRLVIIPWRNTIPFQKLIWDYFGVDVKRNGAYFGVDLGIISGAVQILILVSLWINILTRQHK